MNVFDVVNSITKKDPEYSWEEVADVYVPFLVNKALSFDRRTVLYANQINMMHTLPQDMQFAFYHHAVPKISRPGRWIKTTKLQHADKVAKYYNINLGEAIACMALIPSTELNKIISTP